MENKIQISIVRYDNIEAFGAYRTNKKGDNKILFNVEGTFCMSLENDITFKESMISILMHEFGHHLEELYNLEFDEERIEKIVDSYMEKFGE